MAHSFEQELETRIADLAYTAIGLSIFAYRLSEPKRKQFEKDLAAIFDPRR